MNAAVGPGPGEARLRADAIRRAGRGFPRRGRPALAPAALLALLPLLLLWPTLREIVESRMALHMLVEFPALLASGWAASQLLARRAARARARSAAALLDWQGWTGATLTSAVALVWMLPSALDAALMSGAVNAAKMASWWLAGALLRGSWQRMAPELLLFFVGNLAWMSAGAGMLYLDAPARLCVNYLQGDQRQAGTGLVMVALGLGALLIARLAGSDARPEGAPPLRAEGQDVQARATRGAEAEGDAAAEGASKGTASPK